jgi:hypothetical protein
MPIGISGKQMAAPNVARVGEGVGGPIFVFRKDVSGATTAWTVVKSLEFAVDILGAIVQCTATNASGTVVVTDGTNNITGTITCDTADEVTGFGDIDGGGTVFTVDTTYSSLNKGATIALTTANSAEGRVYVVCVKRE